MLKRRENSPAECAYAHKTHFQSFQLLNNAKKAVRTFAVKSRATFFINEKKKLRDALHCAVDGAWKCRQ